MKKLFAVVLAFICAFLLLGNAVAENEYLFRDVPWGLSPAEVKQKLNMNFNSVDMDAVLGNVNTYITGRIETMVASGYASIIFSPELSVAGYNAEILNLYYRYNNEGDYKEFRNTRFCAAGCMFRVLENADEAYNALRNELISQYGDPGVKDKALDDLIYETEYSSQRRISAWEDETGGLVILLQNLSDSWNLSLTDTNISNFYFEPDYDENVEAIEELVAEDAK